MDFTIPHPIEQIINGNNGIYDLIYIQREAKLLSKYKKAALNNEKVVENKKPIEIEKLVMVINIQVLEDNKILTSYIWCRHSWKPF